MKEKQEKQQRKDGLFQKEVKNKMNDSKRKQYRRTSIMEKISIIDVFFV